MTRILRIALFMFSGFLFAVSAHAADVDNTLTGKVVSTVMRPVLMPFNAIVEEILVSPGSQVEAGSALLKYRLQDEAERVLQREVTNGAGTENLKAQILDARGELATLEAERNKTRQLVSSGLGSRQALRRLEDSVASAESRIQLLESTIRKMESNFQSRLNELEGYFGQPIAEGATLPDILTLSSPIKGYVLSLAPGLNPGQLLEAGSSPVQVGQLDPVLVQIPVYETELNRISVGDPVEVDIPSLNTRPFPGVVSEISWISSDMDVTSPSYYTVEVTVPNPELLLKPGFKAIVRFKGSSSD